MRGWTKLIAVSHRAIEELNRLRQLPLIAIAFALTATSMVLVPSVDKISLVDSQQYPLYYATRLPWVYYAAIIYLVLLAILIKARHVKLISVMLVSVLVNLTAPAMLVNPWVPDQYPYLTEAVLVARDHHTVPFHRLYETPGLALMFSQLMHVTNLGPFEVSEFFPLLAVMVTPFIFLTGERIGGNGVLPTLLYFGFSFHQPIVYHRNSFFIILFIIFLFLFIRSLRSRKSGFTLSSVLLVSALAISYPGTIVPISALALASVLLFLTKRDGDRIVRIQTAALYTVVFLSWYIFIGSRDFRYVVRQTYYGLQDFMYPSIERALETSAYGQNAGLTESFYLISNIRILLTVLLVGLALFLSLVFLLRRREQEVESAFISALLIGVVAHFLLLSLFMSQGLPFTLKFHAFFIYIAVLCVPLLFKVRFVMRKKRRKRRLTQMLGGIALVLLLLSPLLGYATIPFLNVPSSELEAKRFVDEHYGGEDPLLATELNLPYSLFGALLNRDVVEPRAILSPEEPIDHNSSYLTLQRFTTRDGFFIYSITYTDYLENLISSISTDHNLVYDGGTYTKVWMTGS